MVNLTRAIITTTMQEMNKFSNGKIYKVVSPNHPKVYYGSTADELSRRFTTHTSPTNKSTSKQIVDAGDADIFEIEPFPCTCKEELEDREAEYILNDWEGCVNEHIPGAMRRAGGYDAYFKAYNQKPETKAKNKARNQTPEYKARQAEKISCKICGMIVSRRNIAPHYKSKTCQNHLKTELDKVMEDIISSIEISCT